MAERFRAVNKAVSCWDGKAPEASAPALVVLTEAFACLPEQYQNNLVSVVDLIFVSRSLERMAEGLQKGGGGGALRGVLTARV